MPPCGYSTRCQNCSHDLVRVHKAWHMNTYIRGRRMKGRTGDGHCLWRCYETCIGAVRGRCWSFLYSPYLASPGLMIIPAYTRHCRPTCRYCTVDRNDGKFCRPAAINSWRSPICICCISIACHARHLNVHRPTCIALEYLYADVCGYFRSFVIIFVSTELRVFYGRILQSCNIIMPT